MTPAPRHRADEDLEAAVRAMLTRRAADIRPHRPAAGTKVSSIAPIHAPPSRSARLTLVAAITVLVVGAAALFVAAGEDPPPGSGPGRVSEAAGSPPDAIWPAPGTGLMPPATPVSAAATYIFAATTPYTGGLAGPVTSLNGDRATVAYAIQDGGSTVTVSMRRSEGAWYVTGSATDHLRIARTTAVAGVVTADIDPASYRTAFTVLRAELIGTDGTVLAGTEVHDLVMPANFRFVSPAGSTPLAVQLTEVPQYRRGLPDPLSIAGLASQMVRLS